MSLHLGFNELKLLIATRRLSGLLKNRQQDEGEYRFTAKVNNAASVSVVCVGVFNRSLPIENKYHAHDLVNHNIVGLRQHVRVFGNRCAVIIGRAWMVDLAEHNSRICSRLLDDEEQESLAVWQLPHCKWAVYGNR